MYIADILSRASFSHYETKNLNDNIFQVDGIYEELGSMRNKDVLNVSESTYNRLRNETMQDVTLQVKKLILEGSSPEKEEKSLLAREYWTHRELSIQDGIIYKGDRIVLPTSMRTEMMSKFILV
ncbi:hypothetical protein AVEN_213589-1 [Araneus ventricosus]|uniref:Uncharacterized protein n=1 Tax=Araneus ventricosus TaxID=182803 RepID=A0A4Y2HPD6_ARAVE|nr:hypothetical protein AVEN_213589-1 [Araneus ventricosus]